ncbi:MAG: hypothetical protein OEV94_06535 [Deltaproteobacteria bacterium]|nr:hypothetical protein [Deltaproteobacteria bacterium]
MKKQNNVQKRIHKYYLRLLSRLKRILRVVFFLVNYFKKTTKNKSFINFSFVLSIIISEILFVLISSTYSSDFGWSKERRFDRYDKLCIATTSIVGPNEPCKNLFDKSNIGFQKNAHQDTQSPFFTLSYSPLDGVYQEVHVEYSNFKDIFSFALFLFGIIILILNTNIESLSNIFYIKIVIASSVIFLLYILRIYLDDVLIYKHISGEYIYLLYYLLIFLAFIYIPYKVIKINFHKNNLEAYIGAIALVGFSLFVRFAIIENKINIKTNIAFEEEISGFENGSYKFSHKQNQQLNKLLEKIIVGVNEYANEANTIMVEGHASMAGIIYRSNCKDYRIRCNYWVAQNLDKEISNADGTLKPLDQNKTYYFGSNIELGYLRAYVVWDFLKDKVGKNELKTIRKIYIVSASHHDNNPRRQDEENRTVIIRLLKQ